MLKPPFILVLMLTFSCTVIPSLANESPIIDKSPTKQEADKTTDSKENTKTQNQNSTPSLTVTNPTPTQPLQEIRESESNKYSKAQKSSWWNFSLTDVLLAIFTFALVVVGWFQFHILRGTLKATAKAANAAKDSADALPAIERAYLFVEIKIVDREQYILTNSLPPVYIPSSINIIITNHGKTPAIVEDISVDITPTIEKVLIEPKTFVISADDNHQIKEFPINLSSEQWQEITTIVNRKIFLSCHIYIKYKDVFGDIHEPNFCWEYQTFTVFLPVDCPK